MKYINVLKDLTKLINGEGGVREATRVAKYWNKLIQYKEAQELVPLSWREQVDWITVMDNDIVMYDMLSSIYHKLFELN